MSKLPPLPKELARFTPSEGQHNALKMFVQEYGQQCRDGALAEAAKQKVSKPKQLAKCGTGALHDEQQYCFELGYKAGAKAVRTAIKEMTS